MTAYVHIGTPKTGTTSIQNFLHYNHDALARQNYRYAQSIVAGNPNEDENQHWYLVTLYQKIKPLYKNKEFNIVDFLKSYPKFNLLKQEVQKYNNFKFIFSSEGISLSISKDMDALEIFNTIFSQLGFTKLIYICYIRNQADMKVSWSSMLIYCGYGGSILKLLDKANNDSLKILNYQQVLSSFGNYKADLIVRLFDKNEFYQGDLLKDFAYSIGLQWDDRFVTPSKQNESLDLLGIEF